MPQKNEEGEYKTYEETVKDTSAFLEKSLPPILHKTLAKKLKSERAKLLPATAGSIITTNKVRGWDKCSLCDKPRAIFSKKKLTDANHSLLGDLVAESEITCGKILVPTEPKWSSLKEKDTTLDTRVTCEDLVSSLYFTKRVASKIKPVVCAVCLKQKTEMQTKYFEYLKEYKTVVPNCESESCMAANLSGKNGWILKTPKNKPKSIKKWEKKNDLTLLL